jgi:hypothetical protein
MATENNNEKNTRKSEEAGLIEEDASSRDIMLTDNCPTGQELSPQSQYNRDVTSSNLRHFAHIRLWNVFIPRTKHPSNGDEERYQSAPLPDGRDFRNRYIASFTKGLPLSTTPALEELGEVDSAAYCKLLKAIKTGSCDDFEAVPRGSVDGAGNPNCAGPSDPAPNPNQARNFENPQAALAFQLQGADSHDVFAPVNDNPTRIGFLPAPRFDSPQIIGEIAENYWMALLRDVPFEEYDSNADVGAAVTDLNRYAKFIEKPDLTSTVSTITRGNLFRGVLPGDDVGFYLSQFFLHDVPYGAQKISGKVRRVPAALDYMTYESNWRAVQRGCDFNQVCSDDDPEFVFIRNGRDLTEFVHNDNVYNGPYNACYLLLSGANPRRCEALPGFGAPFAEGIPYMNPFANASKFPPVPPLQSKNQIGIATFGPNHLKSLLLEAMNLALIAVWYQKWSVHRRLRPEALAGRIHFKLTRSGNPLADYPLDPTEFGNLGSNATPGSLLDRVFRYNQGQNASAPAPETGQGTYLLPMAFAEGSPVHPSYGQGHATALGAGVTILKAFFRNLTFRELGVKVRFSTAAGDSVEYSEPVQGQLQDVTTVHGELNKLASNIALGRDFPGVHYRSDATRSLLLGEQVAINLLEDIYPTFNEKFKIEFKRFNNQTYTLEKAKCGPDPHDCYNPGSSDKDNCPDYS